MKNYVLEKNFFVESGWDSLFFERYNFVITQGTLLEQIRIYPDGRVRLNTLLIDSLRGRTCEGVIERNYWEKMKTEINRIHEKYFKLYDGIVADATLDRLVRFENEKKEIYQGYDLPLFFINLRNFFNYKYKLIHYKNMNKDSLRKTE